MKLIVRLSPVLLAMAFAMACGDDDDAPPAPTQCKSPYSDRTAEDLEERTSPTGACADDTDAVCKSDVITETSTCATGCFPMYPDDAQKAAACTLDCLHENLAPAPSDKCLNCYLVSVNCTATNCFSECITGGAAAPACIHCRAESGCTAAFYACSGLPLPTGTTPTPNGGAGGAGETGGAPGTGGGNNLGGTSGEAGMTSVAGSGAASGAGGAPGSSGGAEPGGAGGTNDSAGAGGNAGGSAGAGGNAGAGG